MKRENHQFDVVKSKNKSKMKILPQDVVIMLFLLDLGNYPAQVAKVMSTSRQLVNYYIRKYEKANIIEKTIKDANITEYKLTAKGKRFVKKHSFGDDVDWSFRVLLHSLGLKFKILQPPEIEVDWKKVQMNNWKMHVGTECGLTVMKTPKHVIVYASPVEGKNSEEVRLRAVLACLQCATYLESKFRMKLDFFHPSLARKPHYAVNDSAAALYAKYMEVDNDIGKIDFSPGVGHIDYFDAEMAKEHLLMPLRMRQILESVKNIELFLKERKNGGELHGF